MSELVKLYRPKPPVKISRGQWLNRFYYELGKDWNGVEPLSRLRVGIALKRFADWELPVIWKECESSNSFAKTFWWKHKNKPVPKKEKKAKNLQLF